MGAPVTVRWKTSLQWLAIAALGWAVVLAGWCATRLPGPINT